MRRPALPALNAAHLSRRASLRGHTPVAATARRPLAVESLLLAARRGALARAARARSVGRRVRNGLTLSRRSTRRPALPALNAAHLSRRASLRGHTPVAAAARRLPAVESLLLAARRGDTRARCSRPLGRPPRSRRLDPQPPLDAPACATCAERGASLAPCLSARSHARGRGGSTAARRRVAAARRSSWRYSCALLAPARSDAAFATARHSAAASAAACASCAEHGASLAPRFSARSHARGRDGSTAARRRVAAARRSSRRCSRALLAPARSAAAFATAWHSAAARRAGLRFLRCTRHITLAALHYAVTRPWPRRLDGRPPSSRCCSPLVAAILVRAACARSVGRRVRDGSALSRRSMRRPAPPALNAARLSRRASLRGHTPVAATARWPPAVESLLLAARHGDARARCSRPPGRPPRSRRFDTQPPLDAAACASCAERGVSLAPWFSAWSHARGRDGSTAARRRVAAARRSSRRRSRALLASARSAAAFATARHSAAARRGGLRFLR